MSYSRATLKMEVWRVVVVSVFLAFLYTLVVADQKQARTPCAFPAVFNFGDSNSDTGAISAAFLPIRSPYGVPFFNKPSGRASDGRLLIDFIAEKLKFPYLSAYLDSVGSNYRRGANFATGGSTIRRQNETIFQQGTSPFSLDIQLNQFEQFRLRIFDLYFDGKNNSDRNKLPRLMDFVRALYTFDIGQTDLSVGLRTMTSDQLLAAMPDIIDQFAEAVHRVYTVGGRSFWIHNTGPYGCLPVHQFYDPNPESGVFDRHGCDKAKNSMSSEFNRQLKERVVKLRDELPNAAITYVDIYAAKYALISNANKEGFVDPLKVCCGYHVKHSHVWCGREGKMNETQVYGDSCTNSTHYINWDGLHYSDAANRWVASRVLNGSFSDPPIPISEACPINHLRLV